MCVIVVSLCRNSFFGVFFNVFRPHFLRVWELVVDIFGSLLMHFDRFENCCFGYTCRIVYSSLSNNNSNTCSYIYFIRDAERDMLYIYIEF
jgi:hypothetical protein